MSEQWKQPAPVVLEREIVEVNGVLESRVTPRGQADNYNHLAQEKRHWVALHLAQVAEEAAMLEYDQQRFAAD